MKTSKLKAGTTIEVKLDMSDCLEKNNVWEPATYERPVVDMSRGWHHVRLQRARRVSFETGSPTTKDDPKHFTTKTAIVYAARIRLPKEKR